MSGTRHAAIECRVCGYVMDTGAAVDEQQPVPRHGDLSICLGCGAASFFVVGVREPTLDEERAVASAPAVQKIRAAIVRARREAHEAGQTWPGDPDHDGGGERG